GGPVGGRRVVRQQGEGPGLAADPVGRAGDRGRRGDVGHGDRRGRRGRAGVLVGRREGHDVDAVVVRGEREVGRRPGGERAAVLRHRPGEGEPGGRVGRARVGGRRGQGDRRPLGRRGRGAADRRGRCDVVHG